MNKLTMSWVGVACSLALSACSGGSEAVPASITMVKRLDFVACDKRNPVSDEVKLIADTGINPVKRRCNQLVTGREGGGVVGGIVLQCGEVAILSFSVLDVLPSDVAKAKSIGYDELLGATKYDQYDPAYDFPCD